MKSNHVYNKMLLFLEGDLSEEEQKQIEEHLATCTECSNAFAKLKNTMSVIDDEKKLEPSQYLFSKIQNRIESLKETNNILYRKASMINLLKPVYISLLVGFAIFTGMLVGNNLNISSNTNKSKTTYTINSTKDFYILGVDNEAN